MLPACAEIPTKDSSIEDFRSFAEKYNLAQLFHERWGDEYARRADELDVELTRQMIEGRPRPQASAEELLLCFGRMWFAAPYLGIDSLDGFLRNRRVLWLLDGIRDAVGR